MLEAPLDHPLPVWWSELLHFYPWFATLEREPGYPARLRVTAPTHLSPEATLEAMNTSIPNAAKSSQTGNTTWYWQSVAPDAELIRTTSGGLVSQFISVNALCLQEPVAEVAMALAVRQLIDRFRSGDAISVVTDTASSSYLLAKRLFRNDPRVEVIHPDDASSLLSGEVVVFADAVYAGRLVSKRVADLPERLVCRGVVAVFDLRPLSIRAAALLKCPFEAVVTWPFPEEVRAPHPDADILEVAEITNEVLTHRLAAEVRGYKSLL